MSLFMEWLQIIGAKGGAMENGFKRTMEIFLEIARYAGAVVVGGVCLWLVVFGVIFLTRTSPRDA
jgi:hypothetical protein